MNEIKNDAIKEIEHRRAQRKQKAVKGKKNRKRILVISVILIFVLVLGIMSTVAASYDKIYKGISVCGVDLGGMTAEEAKAALETAFAEADPKITVKAGGKQIDLEFGQIAEYDYETSANAAYQKGRGFGFFDQVVTYYSPFVKRDLPLTFFTNEDTLNEKLHDLRSQLDNPFEETTYEVKEEKLLVKTGHGGNTLDTQKVLEKIDEALGFNTDVVIEADVSEKGFEEPDIDKIYEAVHQEAENAKYLEGEQAKLVSHKMGIDFDKSEAKKIIGKAQPDTTYEIPLKITMPEITEAKLTGQMFSETLASYSTNYNPGEVDRTHNMLLASNKINGTVVAPGQVFSYNNVVGVRTVAAGYRNAKVFENGRVVDGLAGGICQVSSTLYNAVLYSNLGIVERQNHSFPVSYTPKGQDATVVMGAIDFRFKNTTSRPIKVVSSVSGGKCTVTILGTKEGNYKVSIENTVLSTIPFDTKYVEDSSLQPGKEKVLQKGSNGYKVSSVRVVSENGKVIKRENLPSSNYIPMAQEVARNKAEGTPSPSPSASPDPDVSPSPSVTPSALPSPTPKATPSATPPPEPTRKPTEQPEHTPAQTPSPKPVTGEE